MDFKKRDYYDFFQFFFYCWKLTDPLEPGYFVRMQHCDTLFINKLSRMPKKGEEFISSVQDSQYVLLRTLIWLVRNAPSNLTLFLQILQLTLLITIEAIPHCFCPWVWLPFSFQAQICPGMDQRCLKDEIFAGRKSDTFSILSWVHLG